VNEQLTLPLGHRAALGADDFIVSESSRDAVAWIDRWPDWPAPGLVIVGPPASGKTHLAEVWRQRSGARAVAAGALGREAVVELAAMRAVVVEDADRSGGDERALLHLFNLLREGGGHLLLTSRSPPARWPLALPDLSSRLAVLPVAALAPPDDAVLESVIVKLFADRQLLVEPEVVRFLANRLDRSFAAVAEAVAALDRAALAHGRAVTVPLVRATLANTIE
jgi:chromosomal replication initiation ATPase DnaA